MASTDPKITFTITCTMNERWAAQFLGMLTKMQQLGSWGSSRMIQFFSDGDGDFRPQFAWATHTSCGCPDTGGMLGLDRCTRCEDSFYIAIPQPVKGRGNEELVFDAG